MEIPSIYGWQALLVVKASDEVYGRMLWKFLSSMDIPSMHGWQESSNRLHQLSYATNECVWLYVFFCEMFDGMILKMMNPEIVLSGFADDMEELCIASPLSPVFLTSYQLT